MNIETLRAFMRDLPERKTMTDADVRAFAADPDESRAPQAGIYETAEMLLAIEASPIRKPAAWRDFFVDSLVDLFVWGERPTGVVTPAIADWLLERMSAKTVDVSHMRRALFVALVREAHSCDPRLVAVAFGYDVEAARPAPVASTLGWLDSAGIQV